MLRKSLFLFLFFVLVFSAYGQSTDSAGVNKPLTFSTRQLYVPGVLMLAGLATNNLFKDQIKYKIVDQRNKHFPEFHTSLDNYLEYAAIPVAYGLDIFGVKSKNDFLNRTAILLKGEFFMYASVNILKFSTHQKRPDGSDYYSFPSGHSAQAFATATFLTEEYKERLPWMPYAAYTVAGSTGILRMANNRHYISDVLFGAGLGFLSMKIAYWTHQYKWGRKKQKLSYPVY